MATFVKSRCLSLLLILYLRICWTISHLCFRFFHWLQPRLPTNMDQPRSYAVEIHEHAQPHRPFVPLSTGLQSIVYAAPRPRWTIAIQKFDGSSSLLSVPLCDWDSQEQLFARAREQLYKGSRQKYLEWCMSMLVLKTVVGTASVKHIMSCDLDPHLPYRVSLQDYEHDPLLTEIFHKTTHLTGNDRAFSFIFSSIDHGQGQRIIVVRRVLDKFKITRLLILLLLISPALGTVVATFIHRAGVGAAVSVGVGVTISAAIFALASFLQALATWFET